MTTQLNDQHLTGIKRARYLAWFTFLETAVFGITLLTYRGLNPRPHFVVVIFCLVMFAGCFLAKRAGDEIATSAGLILFALGLGLVTACIVEDTNSELVFAGIMMAYVIILASSILWWLISRMDNHGLISVLTMTCTALLLQKYVLKAMNIDFDFKEYAHGDAEVRLALLTFGVIILYILTVLLRWRSAIKNNGTLTKGEALNYSGGLLHILLYYTLWMWIGEPESRVKSTTPTEN